LSRRRTVGKKKEHSTNLYGTRQLVRDKDRVQAMCLEETNKKMIEVVRLMS